MNNGAAVMLEAPRLCGIVLVSKFKIIGMLLNVVHNQVQKSEQKHITKESNGFHNHSSLTMV